MYYLRNERNIGGRKLYTHSINERTGLSHPADVSIRKNFLLIIKIAVLCILNKKLPLSNWLESMQFGGIPIII
jgi:hypothetical protein